MKPMSRFTGSIAAEYRRIELLELVATQRAIANQSGARTTRALPAAQCLSRFASKLRNSTRRRSRRAGSSISAVPGAGYR